ncbi:MAG TPA: flagellar hook-length control protein FliK [Vicinamibacterales bacterium]|nr:flagellar hook-length control protein FliK [Vicinamibacterales bacterium]
MLDLARTSAAPDGASNTPPPGGRSHADRPAGGHGADRSFADTLAWLSGAMHGRAGARAHDGAAADAQTDDASPSTSPASDRPLPDAVQSGIAPDWTAGFHAGRHGHGKSREAGAPPADAAGGSKDDKDTDAAANVAAIAAVPAPTPALPDVDPGAAAAASIGSGADAKAPADDTRGAGDAGTSAAAAHGRAPRHGDHRHAGGAHRAAPAADIVDLVTTGTDAQADGAGEIVSDAANAAGAGLGAANAGAPAAATPTTATAASAQPSTSKTDKPADAPALAPRRQTEAGVPSATPRLADLVASRATADQDARASAIAASDGDRQQTAPSAARAPQSATASSDDRSHVQDRADANRQNAGARGARTPNVSVSATTTAAIHATARNAGAGSHESQTGFGAAARPAPQPAAASPAAATVAFGLESGLLASSGPAAQPLQTAGTAVTTWPADGTLPESTVNQIVQAIRLQWANGTGEARITLEPEQFGDVTVSLRVEHGQVSARVEADTPVVREWLQSNQQTLRHGLAEQNLRLDRLEVAAPPESRDADRRDDARQRGGDQPPPRRPRRPQGQETFEVVA